MDLHQLVAGMRDAIRAEKQAVQKALGSLGGVGRVRIRGGRRVHPDPGAQVYRLECDAELTIPEGTRVQLQVPGHIGSGETLRHDPALGEIDCVLREDLGDELAPGSIEFDSTFLLSLLEDRLVAIAGGPAADGGAGAGEPFNHELGFELLTGEVAPRPPVERRFDGLAESQEAAVRFALAQRVTYLWGPPGTGKTQTVGQLVHGLLDAGEKVLLTAHTNIATDNALLRVLEMRRLPPDSVIRVGYHAESLDEHDVGLDAAVDRAIVRSHPEIVEEIESIAGLVADLHPRAARSIASRRGAWTRLFRVASGIVETSSCGSETDLPSRIAQVARRIELLERRILDRAALVATTLTRCYSSRSFAEFRTDAVVVDEASTASLAASFVAGCLARRRAIAVGDFAQLPAIVQASEPVAVRWLGRHVFHTSGADRVGEDHPLRVMLHEQFRMHPDIAGIVSRVFYGGRLTNAAAVCARSDAGPAVALVDTTRMAPASERSAGGSKVNRVHAELVARLVASPPLASRSVAVITPYRAQVRLIRETVRATRPDLLKTGRLEIFTVHRFQGRDKDVVLFDLTEAPGTRCHFLDEHREEHAPNLINVAMSRARLRLVVIGALEHLRASLGARSVVSQVITAARLSGALQVDATHAGDRASLASFLAEGGAPAAWTSS